MSSVVSMVWVFNQDLDGDCGSCHEEIYLQNCVFINVMTPVVKMCVLCVFLYLNKTNLLTITVLNYSNTT